MPHFKSTITKSPQQVLALFPFPPLCIDTAELSKVLEMHYYSCYVNKLV